MGYLCPVCGDPQADEDHLANHLAFTALVHGEDHEAFLDEAVPGWKEMGEQELSGHVTEHAEQAEFPQVFEDTTHDHDHDGGENTHHDGRAENGHDTPEGDPVEAMATDEMDEKTRAIVERARELTRQRRADLDDETDDN